MWQNKIKTLHYLNLEALSATAANNKEFLFAAKVMGFFNDKINVDLFLNNHRFSITEYQPLIFNHNGRYLNGGYDSAKINIFRETTKY